jgi:Tfp pilus assembly protein PilO
MRQLTPREKVIVSIGAAALVVFAYGFLLLLPARRALSGAVSQQAEYRDQLSQAERMYREAIAARGEIAGLRGQSQSLMCPWPDVMSGMVGEIEKLSKELGVTLTSIRPGEVESADGSTRHPVTLKVEADLGKIVRLLYELEQPSRRLWVEGMEIASPRQTEGKLTGTVYVAAYSPLPESEAENAGT